MVEERQLYSCTLESDTGYLYVICRVSISVLALGVLDSIEKLYVNDITNIKECHFISLDDTLCTPNGWTNAI